MKVGQNGSDTCIAYEYEGEHEYKHEQKKKKSVRNWDRGGGKSGGE